MEGFLKWWVSPTISMGFPTKNDHFGVFWGYHHVRKHPYSAPDGSEARKSSKLTGRLDIARRLKTRHLKGQPLFLLSKNDPATKIKLSSCLKWKIPRICNQNKQ